jgi:hypothetical protein
MVNFDSKSVLMKGGVELKADCYIPTFLMDYDIPESVWEKAINDFNKKLADRPSVTCEIKGMDVDLLRVEVAAQAKEFLAMGAVAVYLIVRKKDVEEILGIHFVISGFVTFDEKKGKKVDGMVIENITYGGDDSKRFKILK